MQVTGRVGKSACALALSAAVLSPIAFSSSAPAAENRDTQRVQKVSSTDAEAAKAEVAAKDGGFRSRKGGRACGKHQPKGDTAWFYISAVGKVRVTWKVPGGKLHSKIWPFDPTAITTRTIPTWKPNVYWKVTSVWGTRKHLTKAFVYCSKTGLG
jgi:hypothetical protein